MKKDITYNKNEFYLKHTFNLEMFYLVLFIILTIFFIIVEIRIHSWDWNFFLIILISGIFFPSVSAYYTRLYKVFWRNDTVGMHTIGMKEDVVIPVNEITSIKKGASFERLKSSQGITRRVFRRIAIYQEKSDGTVKFVDVSLKHFIPEDIKKLMTLIHEKRPDLEIPK